MGEGHLSKAAKGPVGFGLMAALVYRIISPEPVRCNNLDARRGEWSRRLSQGVDVPRYRIAGKVLAVRFAMEELTVTDVVVV